MSARVIKPNALTDAMLVSSTAVESLPSWSAETSYAINVRVLEGHRVYQSLVAANQGNLPSGSPLAWVDVGPSNRWAMFDGAVNTATTASNDLSVTMDTGLINSIALVGLTGASCRVRVWDAPGGTLVYDSSTYLDAAYVTDAYQYCFEPFVQMTEVVCVDIPPYLMARVQVDVHGDQVGIGNMVFGMAYVLGDTQLGAGAGITDYSRKNTDDWGNTTLVQRNYSKRSSLKLQLEQRDLNRVHRVLATLRATACVWIGVDLSGYLPLVVFGYYRDFSIEISYPTYSICSLEIEGLT